MRTPCLLLRVADEVGFEPTTHLSYRLLYLTKLWSRPSELLVQNKVGGFGNAGFPKLRGL
ncbi:hypothetical protein [Escherichia phage FXie-2024a]